jgi:hypothetical protein
MAHLDQPSAPATVIDTHYEETASWRFAIDPDTLECDFFANDDTNQRTAERDDCIAGGIFDDGAVRVRDDLPAGMTSAQRDAKLRAVLPLIYAWVRQTLHVEPYLDSPQEPTPEPRPEPDTPDTLTKAQLEEAFRTDDRTLLRQLIASVGALAAKPLAAVKVTAPELVVQPAQVTVTNTVRPPKPRKIVAVAKEDGTREYEVVE